MTSFLIPSTLNKMAFSLRHALVLVAVLILAAILFLMFFLRPNKQVLPTPKEELETVSIQSEILETPIIERSEVRSPDGKMKLIMKKTTSGDNTAYSFSVSGTEEDLRKTVFARTVLTGGSMEMSPNAWSPDNKYFFITEKSGSEVNYFTFRADGEAFSGEKKYIDVAPLFVAKDTGYELYDVTGWASPTLIYLLSKSKSGESGPTYWLEIPSLAIIRPARR